VVEVLHEVSGRVYCVGRSAPAMRWSSTASTGWCQGSWCAWWAMALPSPERGGRVGRTVEMSQREGGLTTLFVRNRHLLVLSVVAIVVAGWSALTSLPRIEDPRITTRNATFITLLPGASAERVEPLVSKPIEDRLKEVSEIKHIDSTSRGGASVIAIELADWVDGSNNEQICAKVRDKLADGQRHLPPAASRPDFDDKRGAVVYSLVVALTWQWDEAARLGILSRLAEDLADRLRNLPGTDQVRLFGQPREEITVRVEPAELAALGLTASDVAARLAAADVKRPAGLLRSADHELKLELTGELDSVGRVAAVPVAVDAAGRVVALGSVAEIEKGWREPPSEIAYDAGARAILVAGRRGRARARPRVSRRARLHDAPPRPGDHGHPGAADHGVRVRLDPRQSVLSARGSGSVRDPGLAVQRGLGAAHRRHGSGHRCPHPGPRRGRECDLGSGRKLAPCLLQSIARSGSQCVLCPRCGAGNGPGERQGAG
jgi:hypothetical protein